jgi:peptidoglycan-associated lipoprotein
MFRQLRKSFVVSAMAAALLVSCSSKKKATDAGSEGATSGAPEISNVDMNFDPTGTDSGTIQGLYTIHFPYDQSILDEDNKQKLSSNGDWVKGHANVVMQIEGHCDNRGSVEYNLALGERRAKAVKAYLVSMGVPADKLRVVSYGKEKPVAQGDTEEAYAKNRRANFVPLPK